MLTECSALQAELCAIYSWLLNADGIRTSAENFEHPVNAPKRLVNKTSFGCGTAWECAHGTKETVVRALPHILKLCVPAFQFKLIADLLKLLPVNHQRAAVAALVGTVHCHYLCFPHSRKHCIWTARVRCVADNGIELKDDIFHAVTQFLSATRGKVTLPKTSAK
jgi:hypothetical protein